MPRRHRHVRQRVTYNLAKGRTAPRRSGALQSACRLRLVLAPGPGDTPGHEAGQAGSEWHLKYHGRLDDATNPDDEPSGEPGFEVREAIDAVLAGESVDGEFLPSRGCTIKWLEGNEPDYWDQV